MKTCISLMLLTIIIFTHPLEAKSQATYKTTPPSWAGVSIGSTTNGISQELMTKYSFIVSKYGSTENEWWKYFEKNISLEDKTSLEQIFKQMTPGQQSLQKVAFIKNAPPLKKIIPSKKKFNSWKNSSIYGIWIDGKKIKNAILNKYQNTDFDQVFISKLYGAAKKNKNYYYQVDLMTTKYYLKYYEHALAEGGSRFVFRD